MSPAGAPRPEGRSLSHAFLGATFWNAILLAPRLLVGLVASVVFYQKLGREEVGLVFFLTSLASSIGAYADLGIERSLPRFLPEVEAHGGRQAVEWMIRRVIRVKLLILLALVLALGLLSRPLIHALAARQTSPSLAAEIGSRGGLFLGAVAALLLFGAIFDVYMQFLGAYFKQKAWNLITLATTLLQPVLVTTFILLGWGIEGVLLGLVATPAVSALLAAWQARRAAREIAPAAGEGRVDGAGLTRRFARFAVVNYVVQLTTWLYDLEFVVFLSAAALGFEQVALLGFAYKFVRDFLGFVWTPLTGVMTPLIARIKLRESPRALEEAHASLTRLIWLLVLPAGVGLALLTPRLLHALYPKYVGAATLVLIFIAFSFAESLLSVPHNVLMVYEEFRIVLLARLWALLSVPLVYVLLPRYGPVGVAIAVGTARVASRLATVVPGVRRLHLTLPAGFCLRVACASALFAAPILLLLRLSPPGSVAGGPAQKLAALLPIAGLALLGAALYALALRALGGLDEAERRRILGLPIPGRDLLRRVL